MASSRIMNDPAAEDEMKGNHEKFPGNPNYNASEYNAQKSGNVIQWFSQPKHERGIPVRHSMEAKYSMFWDPYGMPYQGYSGHLYGQKTFRLPHPHPELKIMQQVQQNPFENNIYPINHNYAFPIGNSFCYTLGFPPAKMFSHVPSHKLQIQEFQYFVVIDFEATCDEERKIQPQEIIEFPSVLVNSATGTIEAFFQTYVRPAYHQHLTDYCKELTGIQQIQVDRGVPLSEAIIMHDKWLEKKGIKHKSFAVVTWGDWDCRVMLESECRFKKITKPAYFNRWINLKVPFQELFQGVRCGLKDAIQLAGLTWEGRPHCGLDDARNTAHLLVHLMSMGYKFTITYSLTLQTMDAPVKYKPISELLVDRNQHTQETEPTDAPVQFHPIVNPCRKEMQTYCYCGVLSSKSVIREPGQTQGRCFFGCGNKTAAKGAACNYFVWASP